MILPEDFREKWDVNKDGPLITFPEKELHKQKLFS